MFVTVPYTRFFEKAVLNKMSVKVKIFKPISNGNRFIIDKFIFIFQSKLIQKYIYLIQFNRRLNPPKYVLVD